MTSSVGIVSTGLGAIASPNAAASTSSANALSTPSAANVLTATVHSPRVTLDPTAGFITQYLSADGTQVISQTPSAISVAYLRLGLTVDGLSKESPAATSVTTKA